jgi:hypothetical protein
MTETSENRGTELILTDYSSYSYDVTSSLKCEYPRSEEYAACLDQDAKDTCRLTDDMN